jgi:hypothetical protein
VFFDLARQVRVPLGVSGEIAPESNGKTAPRISVDLDDESLR